MRPGDQVTAPTPAEREQTEATATTTPPIDTKQPSTTPSTDVTQGGTTVTPTVTPDQVRQIVQEAMAANPGLTETQVQQIVNNALQGLPQGLTTADVSSVVNEAISKLPAAPTAQDINNAVSAAMAGVVTQQDLQQAIAGIQFPAGITPQDVTNAISQYLQQNPGLSAADVAAQVSDQLSKLPAYATPADVDATVRQALEGYATGADLSALSGNLEAVRAELSAAIAGAREQGLSGDSALAAGLEDLAAQLGTTREGLMQSLGVTEGALRSEFATQIGGVQTQISGLEQALQSAIADARASGVQGDDALRLGLESLAGTLGTTREDLLATMGRTEETLRGEFASQLSGTQSALSEAISGVEAGLTGQIGQLQKGFEDQFAAMSASQQQEVLNRIQQGQDLAKAISDVQSGLTGAIADVESGLSGQIGGLRQEVADQYRALSDAQKAEVDNRVQQGEDLSRAISAVQSGLEGRIGQVQTDLGGQIGGLRQEVSDQYRALSDAQKQEVDNRVAMGQNLENAIGDVKAGLEQRLSETQAGLTETIGGVQTGLTQQIGDLDTRFNARVDELVQQGQDQQTATNQAISEMSGGLTSLKEQQERDAKLQLSLQQQQGALQTAGNLGASGRQQIIDPYKATFKDPFVVGGEAAEFKSPLAGFLGSAMKSSFLPTTPTDTTQSTDRLGSEYFDMPGITGMQNPLDMYVEAPFEGLYGFKAGGMVPL
ncbi:MAG TPA: hypothetical protein VLA31_02910, partial [Burkholderiaceae bacterium]|nr:hypothetical protein [Burkholderiaceae bacterium]